MSMKRKVLSLMLTAAVALVMVFGSAASVFAAGDATVYVTISNQGTIATASDGTMMADVAVSVDDGVTLDAVLTEVHEKYCQGGYEKTNTSAGYAWVTKLWGVDNNPASYSFFKNNEPTESVDATTVNNGDHIVASVNQDSTYYSDWFTFFDAREKTVKEGESFTLTLNGYQNMVTNPTASAVENVKVGTVSDNTFSQIDSKTTDSEGKVELSFDEEGTYYVSADGSVSREIYDFINDTTVTADCPIIAPVCKVIVTADSEEPATTDDDDSDDDTATTETTATTNADKSSASGATATGDDFNAMPYIVIAAIAAVGGVVAVFVRRKHV